ncbi:MAG TPA: right-handed parallel beta-helix repeat-containing protein [Stellaceae bacterium]|nr:right-handed parallel beta-helix repeat-containing protein [Stellaceae bacterium]
MRGFRAVVLASAAVALALPASADMIVKLKDGRSLVLPVNPGDIESVTFGTAPPAAAGAKAATVAPVPLDSSAPPAVAGAPGANPALLPHDALLPAALKPDSPSGRVLHVGPAREIKTIEQASKLAKDGDVIEIDSGDYRGDVATWSANDIVIRGIGGRPHLIADGNAAQGKGIWVTHGNKIRIENIEFSGATVHDGNGAGIRGEGAGLTIVNCYFHDNEEGILTAPNANSDIDIESSEFARNGSDSGRVHGIYIGDIRTLIVRGSYFHGQIIGHHIKSRAATNYILYNRIMDFGDGTASYSIDLSNGGRSYVIGNIIEKGPRADNYASIAYAMEGPTKDVQELYVVGNTMLMDRSSGIFVRSRGPNPAFIADNIFAGPGAVLQGAGKLINNVVSGGRNDPELNANGNQGNRVVGDVRFVDAAHGDYHLLPGSPAIGAGADPGQGAGFKLLPNYEPLSPLGIAARPSTGTVDAGALRFQPKS